MSEINPSRVQTQNAIEGLNYASEHERKRLHRKLSDLIYDVGLVEKGLVELVEFVDRVRIHGGSMNEIRDMAQALREAIERAKPEGR